MAYMVHALPACDMGAFLCSLPHPSAGHILVDHGLAVLDLQVTCAGMLPLARELLQRGTAVVLAANSQPSINDITAPELTEAVQKAADADPVIRRGLMERTLLVVSSGNDLPVIDLRKVTHHHTVSSAQTQRVGPPAASLRAAHAVCSLIACAGLARACTAVCACDRTCLCSAAQKLSI